MPRYGNEHRRAKAAWEARWQPGDLCPRCHHRTEIGDLLDLDHDDDGHGYLGLSHASPCRTCGKRCNQSAGGQKAAIRAGKRLRQRICTECGKPYQATSGSSGARQETCSLKCAGLRRSRLARGDDPAPPPVSGRVW